VLSAHLELVHGFFSSPLLPLKHFATRQRHAGPHRPENPQESLGKTPSPGRGAARHHADTLDRYWYSVANPRPSVLCANVR
jgi:hypothetical protein